MKKTFCDRCGEQCINTTANLRLDVVHHTQNNQYVGEDEYGAAELCKSCLEEIEEVLLPFKLTLRHKAELAEDTAAMEMSEPALRATPRVHITAQEVPHD